MYELIILGMLVARPFHGYLVVKIISDVIGPFARASTGRVYPLLSQMERDGLVTSTEEQHQGRTQRVFSITDAGRKRFHLLMMDTSSNPKGYEEIFRFKVVLMEFLKPEEQLHLVDHYITYCHAHILHLNGQIDEFLREQVGYWSKRGGETFLSTMRHMVRQWELEMEWARGLRSEIARAVGAG